MRMNKFLSLICLLTLPILPASGAIAQEAAPFYLRLEFIRVADEQEGEWLELVEFAEPVMAQRIENGEITGADLWSLQPGGTDQGYQYLGVTVYDDPVVMMEDAPDWRALIQAAYPDMRQAEISRKLDDFPRVRDIGRVYYLELIGQTESDFQMPLGTLVQIDHMKVVPAAYQAYEETEMEVFLPLHQRQVDNGNLATWQLLRLISPRGSDAPATHITVNMYSGYDQFFNRPQLRDIIQAEGESLRLEVEAGLETRDHVWSYLGTLVKSLR